MKKQLTESLKTFIKENDVFDFQMTFKEHLEQSLHSKINPTSTKYKTSLKEANKFNFSIEVALNDADDAQDVLYQLNHLKLDKDYEIAYSNFFAFKNKDDMEEVIKEFKNSGIEVLDSGIIKESFTKLNEAEPVYWLTTKGGHRVPLDKNKKALGTVANGTIKKGFDFSKADVEKVSESELKLLDDSFLLNEDEDFKTTSDDEFDCEDIAKWYAEEEHSEKVEQYLSDVNNREMVYQALEALDYGEYVLKAFLDDYPLEV